MDPRFAKMYSDPRFQRFPKKKAKVEIDSRFAGGSYAVPVAAVLQHVAVPVCLAHGVSAHPPCISHTHNLPTHPPPCPLLAVVSPRHVPRP